MNKTIKCWIIANLETLNGISFFLLLFIMQAHARSEASSTNISTSTQASVFQWILIIIAMLSDIFVSIKIAIYTYRNFDEVVSLRMLFHNSKVSFFQAQLKYSISRFGLAFMCILFLYLDTASLFL